MNNIIVRIQSIELNNFKNIEYGKIDFISYKNKTYYEYTPEILGIYGQNGSGKTSVINAIELLKDTIEEKPLSKDVSNYIYQKSDTAELKFIFYILDQHSNEENNYLVEYKISLTKNDNNVEISNEILSFKKNNQKNKTVIIETNLYDKKIPILPLKRYKELLKINKEYEIDMQVIKKICKRENKSFIFNEDTLNIFDNIQTREYYEILNILKTYSTSNLFIINKKYSAGINLDFMPISYRLCENDEITYGNISVYLTKETSMTQNIYNVITKVIAQMNIVLNKIIPNMKIELVTLGKDYNQKGQEFIKTEIFSIKENMKIPLKYESEGIKKIISILSTLISVFNEPSVFLVIDELDAGIFEFLLGELLEMLNKHGKGQLLFTSHDLRALEKLPSTCIIVSTANTKNRFIRIPISKGSKNLRDSYLRGIDLGGLNEPIYDSTNTYEIAHAFRKAGINFEEE